MLRNAPKYPNTFSKSGKSGNSAKATSHIDNSVNLADCQKDKSKRQACFFNFLRMGHTCVELAITWAFKGAGCYCKISFKDVIFTS